MVHRGGFEPPYVIDGQIYSLLPLTTRPPVHIFCYQIPNTNPNDSMNHSNNLHVLRGNVERSSHERTRQHNQIRHLRRLGLESLAGTI